MPTILERITGHRRAAAKVAGDSYHELVHQTESGQDGDPINAIAILDRAGKTEGDLSRDVELIRQRRRLAEQFGSLSRIRTEIAANDKAMAAAKQQFEAAERAYKTTMATLTQTATQLGMQYAAADMAGAELARTCTDPVVLHRENVLGVEVSQLELERKALEDELSSTAKKDSPGWKKGTLQRALKQAEQTAANFAGNPKVHSPKVEVARLKAELAELAKTLSPLEKKLAEITKRRAEIESERVKLGQKRMEV